MKHSFTITVLVLFLVLTGIFYYLKTAAPQFNHTLLMVANGLMAGLTLVSWQIVRKQLAERPQAFVRGVYGATLLKLMICIGSILFYVLLNRKNIHKPSLFVLFGIYAVYTTVETIMLSKLARQVK